MDKLRAHGEAVVVPGQSWLNRIELEERKQSVTSVLQQRAIKRAVFAVANCLEVAELLLGARTAGIEYLLLNPRLAVRQLAGCMSWFKPDLLIATDDVIPGEWRAPERRYLIGDWEDGWREYSFFLREGTIMPTTVPAGRLSIMDRQTNMLRPEPHLVPRGMTIPRESVVLVAGPVHDHLHIATLQMALESGATAVILRTWSPAAFLRALSRYSVTHTSMTEGMARHLSTVPEIERFMQRLPSLSAVFRSITSPYRASTPWLNDDLVTEVAEVFADN